MRSDNYQAGQTLYAVEDIPNAMVFGDEEEGLFAAAGTPCIFLYRQPKPRDRFICIALEGRPAYGVHDSFFTDRKPEAETPGS
jgi:hypothetical protein